MNACLIARVLFGVCLVVLVVGSGTRADEVPVHVVVDDATKLAGTLWLPDGAPRAAAVMISGTGHHTRDQVISGAPMFRAIAEALARRGVATLRFDESGVGESSGPRTEHFKQRVAHVAAALDALRSRPELTGVPIGLLGHSEGALVAPLVCGQRPGGVAFLILLSVSGMTGKAVWVDQMAAMSPENDPAKLAETRAALEAITDAAIAANPDKVRETVLAFGRIAGVPEQAVRDGALDGFIERMASVEMQVFLSYDPVPAFAGVRAPMLVVWGSIDKQTAPALNEPPLKAACHRDAKVSIIILPDEDHFFMRGQDLPPGKHEYGKMSVSPALFDTMGRWFDTTFGRN
jgi:hypothetical protein